jgi:hypothetical protein
MIEAGASSPNCTFALTPATAVPGLGASAREIAESATPAAIWVKAWADLVLEGAVLLIGLGLVHLTVELGDFFAKSRDLLLELAVGFTVLRQSRLISFELLFVGIELLFDLRDVLREPLDLLSKLANAVIHHLQVANQPQVMLHDLRLPIGSIVA